MNSSNSASLLVMETTASPTTVQRPRPLLGTITSLASLREHLQWAIELEHATIPPYLCALYSIKPGHNAQAREVLSSVMVE
jgi:ferritin-like protein